MSTVATTDLAWQDRAACNGMNVNLFFPERGQPPRAGKRVCARCPVRAQCLAYAVANGEEHGIWGGIAGRETRERKAAA